MHPDLERLIKLLDAIYEAQAASEALNLQREYDALLDEVLEGRPRMAREQLHRAVQKQLDLYLRANRRQPPTLPPSA